MYKKKIFFMNISFLVNKNHTKNGQKIHIER